MNQTKNQIVPEDPFDLNRFITAQEPVYDRVISELNHGRKRSHWIWYIFPQLDGLARSATAQHYAIKSRAEAIAYLNHPLLGERIVECANKVLAIKDKTVAEIYDYPDDLKLKSSMTLFSEVGSDSVFARVLDQYFSGDQDYQTLQLLTELENANE